MGKKDKKKDKSNAPSTNTLWEAGSTTSQTSKSDEDDDDDATSVVTDIEVKDSLEEIDERTDVEKELFQLIEDGDIPAVKQLILDHRKDIVLTHKDFEGHDLLTHAVESGKKKMVTLVLSIDPGSIETREALLHAIKQNRMGIMLKILYFEDSRSGGAFYATTKRLMATQSKWSKAHKSSKKKKGGKKGESHHQSKFTLPESFDNSEYGNDITPLMMAAKHGRYEIMQVLHNRGERLPILHMPSCSCPQCKGATRDLERTKKRINLLKAMGNPSYMIFMAGQDGSFDPVFEAFELCEAIKQCATEEPEFKEQYEEILEDASNLPVKLLNYCRTTEETKIFLSQKEGYVGPSSMPYPRLAVAIERDHKDIVAHHNVQFLLQNEFNGPVWKTTKTDAGRAVRFGLDIGSMILFPIIQLCLWFSLFCCSGIPPVQYLLSPRGRCVSMLGSYIFFCIALFFMNAEERAEADIEPPTIYVRWVVFIYVIALLLNLLRRVMLHPGVFLKSSWNIFDCCTQLLFVISFGFWISLFIRKTEMEFEVTLPRRKLPADDPLLLEECAFSLASTFAILRLLRWFTFSSSVGPFQSGLYRMASKVLIVITFVAWNILTFGLSCNIIFRPYKNLTKYDEKDLKIKDQPMDMCEFDSLFMHFFAGEVGPDQVEIMKVNRTFTNAQGVEETVENEHETTQWFATFVCVVWNVVAIAFLKDSITGLFGSCGDAVMEAKDKEWKYDRAKEMLYYIQDGHLAPPFNLLPNGACMSSVCGWLSAMTCGRGKGQLEAGFNCMECCYLRDVESPEMAEETRRQYPWLLRTLFQRFFKDKDDENDEKAQKEDVDEVHEQVKDLREFCLKELLGQKTPSKGASTATSSRVVGGPSTTSGESGAVSGATLAPPGTRPISSVQVVVPPGPRNKPTP